eukprot:c7702_g1_i1.p1 GENE.c7702_g1_i1~~c7702_g1_i1.p1  ORF type:complete len:407 (-),score=102.57 c7702_g1_i1:10-1230(-)
MRRVLVLACVLCGSAATPISFAETETTPPSTESVPSKKTTPLTTIQPHDGEDIPDCGIKPVPIKTWLAERARWTDRQFRDELNFNRRDVQYEEDGRPSSHGEIFATCQDCSTEDLIPEGQRSCFNRTGGANVTFHTSWFLESDYFTTRQWRSIESVFYHHPQATVVVFSNTLNTTFFTALSALGCQVEVEPIQLKQWALSTDLEPWTQQMDLWKDGQMFFDHLNDAVGLLTLHHRGGVYFNTDTIFTNPISFLHNAIGRAHAPPTMTETNTDFFLSTNVMKFDRSHQFVESALNVFVRLYDTQQSAGFGDRVVTQVWNETFGFSNAISDTSILSRDAFCLISKANVANYFVAGRKELVTDDNVIIREHSYALKTWGDQTRKELLMEGSLVYHVMNEFCLLCDKVLV